MEAYNPIRRLKRQKMRDLNVSGKTLKRIEKKQRREEKENEK